jgi:hypothetical protein
MAGFQQSTESLDTDDLAVVSFMLWFNDLIDALVDPLMMIVFKSLRPAASQLGTPFRLRVRSYLHHTTF